MNNLETLRKQYDQLKPFERAAMLMEAFSRMDKEAVEALEPKTLWDACHTIGDEMLFGIIAFTAIHESQRGEVLYWAGATELKSNRLRELEEDEDEGGILKSDEAVKWALEGVRRACAWILALEELDRQAGAACMAYAKLIARNHIEHIKKQWCTGKIDYSSEFGQLKDLWNSFMEHNKLDGDLRRL